MGEVVRLHSDPDDLSDWKLDRLGERIEQPLPRWSIEHRHHAEALLAEGDLEAAEWHLERAERVRWDRQRPIGDLGEPLEPIPEADFLLRSALIAERLGLVTFRSGDWRPHR